MKKKILNKHLVLHLTLIEDIGSAIIQKIQARSDMQISDLYSFSQIDWMHNFGFTEITAQKLVDGLANTKILEEELALIEQNNIQWVTFEDEQYPQLLKQIYLPPVVLYFLGSAVFNSEKKLLAIVGARKADQYGYQVINQLIPELVAAQYTIVSGGALGIDAAAHEATIKSGGKTIAVLGSGLLQPYPMSNKKLFASIVESGGCMVSSFPLRMLPMSGHFPARNRIITGLSHGCLVVQAAQKSGALISAHYALEQGREVFAIPGPIGSELSVGCNTLIQQGAKLVTCSADILEEFGDRMIIDNRVIQEKAKQLSLESVLTDSSAHNPSIHFPSHNAAENTQGERIGISSYYSKILSPTARPECPEGVYRRVAEKDKYVNYSQQQKLIIFACKQPISFDAIVNATQLTHELIQTELFNLQFDGVIEQDFTGMWTVSKI